MYTGVMTLLAVTTTEHERPTYIGFTGLTWGAGTVLGRLTSRTGGCIGGLANACRSNHWGRIYR